MKNRLASWVRSELASQGFAWRPTLILLLASIFYLWSHYYQVLWVIPGTGLAVTEYFISRFILPMAAILILFRESPVRFGLGLGRIRLGLGITGLFMIAYIPCFVVLMHNEAFVQYHGFTREALERLTLWDVAGGQLYLIPTLLAAEFFFRGFILLGLRKTFGDHGANMVQLFPYAMGHLDRPGMECFGSLLVGYALGYLTLKTGSVWYGTFLHWLMAAGFRIVIYLMAA